MRFFFLFGCLDINFKIGLPSIVESVFYMLIYPPVYPRIAARRATSHALLFFAINLLLYAAFIQAMFFKVVLWVHRRQRRRHASPSFAIRAACQTSRKTGGDLRRRGKIASYSIIFIFLLNNPDFENQTK